MAIDMVAWKTCGSFLYAGCYRARGALTCADRAAWGLSERLCHERVKQPDPKSPAVSKRAKCARAPVPRAPQQTADSGPRVFWHEPRAGKPHLRIAGGSESMVPYEQRFVVTRAAPVAHRAVRWQRIHAMVGGQRVICLVFCGRAFVYRAAIASGSAP